MGLLGGFKGKLKGTKQKSRKSISTQVVCVKYKVNSEFDSDNNYPSSSRQNGGNAAMVSQKKPRVIPDAQNVFQPSAVKTYDPPVFETVAPKTEPTKPEASRGTKKEVNNDNDSKKESDIKPKLRTEGTKKKASKTNKVTERNTSKVEEPKKATLKENKKDDEAKPSAPKSPVFKTVTPKTETEKEDVSKAQKVKENFSKETIEASAETTRVKNQEKKSPLKPKSPEAPNEAIVSNKNVRPKKKQAPKAKAPKKEIEKKSTPTPARKMEAKNETTSTKPEQKTGTKSDSANNGFIPKPDENSNIYAVYSNIDDDKEESFKIHVVDHANSFYANLSDAETTEAEDNDDFKFVQMKNPHSPINYSSQAASIFFGGEEEVVVRPRNVVMNDDDHVSQGSSASA